MWCNKRVWPFNFVRDCGCGVAFLGMTTGLSISASEDDDDDASDLVDDSSGDESSDEDSASESSDLEGAVPTAKRRKRANTAALEAAISSGMYPEYKGSLKGPVEPMNPNEYNSLDFLQLLWPESLVDVVVEETNRYGLNRGGHKWVNITREDVWAFLGIIICMGIHRLPNISDYWSKDSLLGVADVRKSMSLRKFWSIWSNLHVVDNSQLPAGAGLSDKLGDVLKILGDTFARSYFPGQELSVDEAMVKYKGKVKKGKVYMPRKPVKRGFKIWCCSCSCCGYLCTFRVYEGKPASGTEKGLVMKVVLDLLSPFEQLNHVLYLDNYFTSGPLVEALANVGIYTAGTIKKCAEGFPESLKDVKPPPRGYVAEKVGGTCYYTFNDRKVVSFVSNAFPEAMDEKVARLPPNRKALTYQQVPPVQPAYNKYMGAVDRLSQLRRTYGYDRKSKRYWVRAFMTFFDYAIVNSYILYKHNCSNFQVKAVGPKQFRLNLVRLLMREGRHRKSRCTPGVEDSLGLCRLVRVGDVQLSRGRCVHCRSGYTTFACKNCEVRLCKLPCYDDYHRYSD